MPPHITRFLATNLGAKAVSEELDELQNVGGATCLLELLLRDLPSGLDGTEKDVEPVAEKTVDVLEVSNLVGAKLEDEGDEGE